MTIIETPSIVYDHPFEPRLEPVADRDWSYVPLPPNPYLCKQCRLSEAAHLDTTATRDHASVS